MYAELQLTEPLCPTLRHLTKNGWVLVCGSYTKTVAPDYRIGWLEAGRFRTQQQLKFTTTVAEPVLPHRNVGTFLENGGYDLHLRQLKNAINNKLTPSNLIFVVIFQSVLSQSSTSGIYFMVRATSNQLILLELFHQAMDEKSYVCRNFVLG